MLNALKGFFKGIGWTKGIPPAPVLLRSRLKEGDGPFDGRCQLIFKGNSRTKGSYLFMAIPLRFLSQGINSMFAFRSSLPVVLEILNDEEFTRLAGKYHERGYAVFHKDCQFTIFIPESRKGSIIDLGARGLVAIYKSFNPGAEDLFGQLRDTIGKVMEAIPRFVHVPPPGPDPEIIFPDGGGVRIVYFTLLVKMDSLERKYPGGYNQFLEDAHDYEWCTDGKLVRAISMGNYFGDTVGLLIDKGLQCDQGLVDFYLFDAGFGNANGDYSHLHFFTHDDGQLERFTHDDGRYFMKLKQEEARP